MTEPVDERRVGCRLPVCGSRLPPCEPPARALVPRAAAGMASAARRAGCQRAIDGAKTALGGFRSVGHDSNKRSLPRDGISRLPPAADHWRAIRRHLINLERDGLLYRADAEPVYQFHYLVDLLPPATPASDWRPTLEALWRAHRQPVESLSDSRIFEMSKEMRRQAASYARLDTRRCWPLWKRALLPFGPRHATRQKLFLKEGMWSPAANIVYFPGRPPMGEQSFPGPPAAQRRARRREDRELERRRRLPAGRWNR